LDGNLIGEGGDTCRPLPISAGAPAALGYGGRSAGRSVVITSTDTICSWVEARRTMVVATIVDDTVGDQLRRDQHGVFNEGESQAGRDQPITELMASPCDGLGHGGQP